MKSESVVVFGYCRECWRKLTFTLNVKGKTVAAIRAEIQAIHYQWGCTVADVRLVKLVGPHKTVHIQRPTEQEDTGFAL